MDFPNSPTETTGLQGAFAIEIRKAYKKRLEIIYDRIIKQALSRQSMTFKEAIDPKSLNQIMNVFEGVNFDMAKIISKYIGISWAKANKRASDEMKLNGARIEHDKKLYQEFTKRSYSYIVKFNAEKRKELEALVEDGIKKGYSIQSVADIIKQHFKVTSYKSELWARTAIIESHGIAIKEAIVNAGVTKEYRWLTSRKENVCKVCRPLHGRVFSIFNKDAPMPIKDTHPQCNCGIVPYVNILNLTEEK